MKWLTDYTRVEFPGLDLYFNVYENLVEFTIPGWDIDITIKFYGVIIAFGFILAVLFGGRMAYKWKMSIDKMLDVLIWGTMGGIIGARLYYVIFQWDNYKGDLLSIFKIWEGGIAIYGAIIGAVISTYIYCRIKKIKVTKLLDVGAFGLLIGQITGRGGNFVNAEAYGAQTTLPWRMELLNQGISVHPTFLYESLWNFGVFLILWLFYRKRQKFSGEIFLAYIAAYGAGRFWIEGLRTDSLYLGPLRVSQIVALLCVVIGTGLIIYFRTKAKNAYVDNK